MTQTEAECRRAIEEAAHWQFVAERSEAYVFAWTDAIFLLFILLMGVVFLVTGVGHIVMGQFEPPDVIGIGFGSLMTAGALWGWFFALRSGLRAAEQSRHLANWK